MRSVSLEEAIIAIVRILGALPVLRWSFVGAVVAVLVDLSDLFLKNFLHLGGVSNYQSFDKWLDQVYQVTFLVVAVRKWNGPARSIAIALFVFRLGGFALFEATGSRGVLLFFPNVFEFWFVFVASLPHWRPQFRFTPRNCTLALALLTPLKLFQEYALHVARWLDDFTTIDVLEAIWHVLRGPFEALT